MMPRPCTYAFAALACILILAACGGGRTTKPKPDTTAARTGNQDTATVTNTEVQPPPEEAFTDPEEQARLALLKSKILVMTGGRFAIEGKDVTFAELDENLRKRALINRFAAVVVHIPASVGLRDSARFMDLTQKHRLTNVRITRTP